MQTIFLIFLLLLTSHPIHSTEPTPEISWSEILSFPDATPNPYHNKLIQIKGFIYKSTDNQLYLSQEPNLKSCCIGSKNKRQSQILLSNINIVSDNDYTNNQHVKIITGKLIQDPVQKTFIMENPSIQDLSKSFPITSVIIIIIFILLTITLILIKSYKNKRV